MRKILFSALVFVLMVSCSEDINESFEIKNSEQSSKSNRIGNTQSLNRFGTIDSGTGEFIIINNDTSTLDPVSFPYVDSYNVAYYDNSYLLYNCPNNGRQCIDLSHFIGKYIIPISSRQISTFYGEGNIGFDNIYGTIQSRIFEENGSQNLLVTNSWMTNDAANTVLNLFRAEIKNNFQLKQIKAFRIHTKEYFGPSRRVVVEIKTSPY